MEHCPVRVVGIGFRGAATMASLQDALQKALAVVGAKSRETAFRELAQLLAIPGLGVSQTDLGQMITPTQSQRIQDRFGTGSLAEAAALAVAGPAARLVAARVISGDGMATAAIAES
jgi:cobalt-precorrin 5A hydrolase